MTAPVREERYPTGWGGRLPIDGKPGLVVGAVVTYNGQHLGEHVFDHVIVHAREGRYELSCRDYPEALLQHVHPAHIHPTGRVVDVCTCGHEQGTAREYEGQLICPAAGCPCSEHSQEPTEREEAHR